MNKGISFYFGFDLDKKERVNLINKYGFSHFITTADKRRNKQNGTLGWQVRSFKKLGILPSSLHQQYDTDKLHYFWEEGNEGNKQVKMLTRDVKLAKKYGFSCVVVHLFGEYSQIGIDRLKRVLEVCEKLDIPLAIENINCQKLFLEVFKNVKHKYLKFCYDSGHNNVFDSDYDYLAKFEDKLIALHLHDNDGSSDQHTLNQYGNINWEKIARRLQYKKDLVLDYELLLHTKPENLSPQECLEKVKKQADELESMILKINE